VVGAGGLGHIGIQCLAAMTATTIVVVDRNPDALELAAQLELTSEQKTKTEALFETMQARAIMLGKELVQEERALDRLFASRTVSSETLENVLARIGRLQGQVRRVHLDAHLKQTALLTSAQIDKYDRLRGYGMTQEQETHQPRQH